MTKNEAVWAKAHDWHVQSTKTLSGNWIVYVRADVLAGDIPDLELSSGIKVMQFAMYEELRAWAGY